MSGENPIYYRRSAQQSGLESSLVLQGMYRGRRDSLAMFLANQVFGLQDVLRPDGSMSLYQPSTIEQSHVLRSFCFQLFLRAGDFKSPRNKLFHDIQKVADVVLQALQALRRNR